jgi:hypothetical protein
MLSSKLAIRLARRWQDAWEATRKPKPALDTAWERLESRFDIARQVRQRFDFASVRQFPVGVRNLTADLGYHLGELARLLASLREDFTAKRPPPANLASWLADVRQLEDEFGAVEVRWKETVVRVVTDPITLRDVELGPFAIDFHWDRLGSAKGVNCFDFIALEPNPAAGRDEIVHPHVQGHDLCAGDATAPLQRALEQGRFPEAFLIIRSVLATYNSSSPYVALEQWSGSPCRDCGRRVEDEDRYACESCDADMCEHCATSCAACQSSRCNGCLDVCAICDALYCSGCLESIRENERICPRCFELCAQCGTRVPKDELIDRLCPDCIPEEESENDDELIEIAIGES